MMTLRLDISTAKLAIQVGGEIIFLIHTLAVVRSWEQSTHRPAGRADPPSRQKDLLPTKLQRHPVSLFPGQHSDHWDCRGHIALLGLEGRQVSRVDDEQ